MNLLEANPSTQQRLAMMLLGIVLGIGLDGCASTGQAASFARLERRATSRKGSSRRSTSCEDDLVATPASGLIVERLPPVDPNATLGPAAVIERLPPVDDPELLPSVDGADLASESSRMQPDAALSWPERLLSDQANFYSPRSLGTVSLALLAGGALANTGADENFRDFYQENIRNAATDEWYEALHAPKIVGDGWVALPAYVGASVAGRWADSSRWGTSLSTWGDRSWRSVLVGAAPLVALQRVTGGSRPAETDHSSDWRFNNDNNGVSGHAFMGAVPFLTAATLTDDPAARLLCYAGSTLTGLSRINDDGHYLSQSLLGWSLAWVAVEAVRSTDLAESQSELHVGVFPTREGMAAGIEVTR